MISLSELKARIEDEAITHYPFYSGTSIGKCVQLETILKLLEEFSKA
jgi:hypothetical protein